MSANFLRQVIRAEAVLTSIGSRALVLHLACGHRTSFILQHRSARSPGEAICPLCRSQAQAEARDRLRRSPAESIIAAGAGTPLAVAMASIEIERMGR